MTQENNKQNTIRFENAQELMDYIGVSRATLYRRLEAYKMKSSKRVFTQDELELLKQQPEKDTKQKNTDPNTEMFKEVLRSNETILNDLKQSYETVIQNKDKELMYKDSQIEQQQIQLDTKDKQIEELHTLIDQQQKLSAQLKLELEEVREPRGFWSRLFGGK